MMDKKNSNKTIKKIKNNFQKAKNLNFKKRGKNYNKYEDMSKLSDEEENFLDSEKNQRRELIEENLTYKKEIENFKKINLIESDGINFLIYINIF
jgi:hypothetical protein